MGPLLTVLSVVTTAVGTLAQASGQMQAGENARKLGEYQQRQYNERAMEEVATGQRAMLERQRKTGLVESKLQANAAASGADPNSPSTLNLGGQIAGRGEYEALMDLSKGQAVAAGDQNLGAASKYEGDLKASMAPMSAIGTIAGGAGGIFKTIAGRNLAYG